MRNFTIAGRLSKTGPVNDGCQMMNVSERTAANAILPAQVVNPGLTKRMQADPHLEGTFLRGIPIGRLGKLEDIQGLAIFLASDASSWITGALIPMDGGNLAVNAGGTVGKR